MIQKVLLPILLFVVIFLLTFTVVGLQSVELIKDYPTAKDFIKYENVDSLSTTPLQKRAIIKSRGSTVRVFVMSDDRENISSLSGTIFKYKARWFVLTAAHGILSEKCSNIRAFDDETFYQCRNVVVIDRNIDYAVFEIDEIEGKTPLNIPRDLPSHDIEEYAIMRKVYFTAYPNNVGPLTVSGEIVGYNLNTHIYIHSYGWSGSSGGGVFNESGELVGIIHALDIGQSEYGLDVMEDLILIVPEYWIDWDWILENM